MLAEAPEQFKIKEQFKDHGALQCPTKFNRNKSGHRKQFRKCKRAYYARGGLLVFMLVNFFFLAMLHSPAVSFNQFLILVGNALGLSPKASWLRQSTRTCILEGDEKQGRESLFPGKLGPQKIIIK